MLQQHPEYADHLAAQRRRAAIHRIPVPSFLPPSPTPIVGAAFALSPDADAWQAVGDLAASLAADLATRRAEVGS